MSIFVCHTCDKYCDADNVGCDADNEYNLHCEECLDEMSAQELYDLGFEDRANEVYKIECEDKADWAYENWKDRQNA